VERTALAVSRRRSGGAESHASRPVVARPVAAACAGPGRGTEVLRRSGDRLARSSGVVQVG